MISVLKFRDNLERLAEKNRANWQEFTVDGSLLTLPTVNRTLGRILLTAY